MVIALEMVLVEVLLVIAYKGIATLLMVVVVVVAQLMVFSVREIGQRQEKEKEQK